MFTVYEVYQIPEISNLKTISQIFHVSLDELLSEEICIGSSDVRMENIQSEYAGYCCDIELIDWNDGVYGVLNYKLVKRNGSD